MARGYRSGPDTRNRAQSRLGFRRAQAGGRGAAASPPPLEAAAPAPPSASESARDQHEVSRERLQKLIGDVVGKHILVPFDHWDYGDEDAQEEPRVAVSIRITTWDGEGNVKRQTQSRQEHPGTVLHWRKSPATPWTDRAQSVNQDTQA